MDEPIILNETDFEENLYDFYTYLMYKGKPFTGTVIQPEYNWITEFKDGNAHGRNIGYFDNGQLASDEVYEIGKYISGKEWYSNGQMEYDSIGKSWYENGQLKTDSTGADRLCWDKDGILVRRNDTWFYKNGKKIDEELADGTIQLFTSGGELAAKTQKLTDKAYDPTTGTYHEHVRYYYDRILRDAIDELFTKPYPEFDYGPDQILWLFGWVGVVYSENVNEGHILLKYLLEHPEEKTRRHAAYLLQLASKKENGNTEITYWLESSPFTIII